MPPSTATNPNIDATGRVHRRSFLAQYLRRPGSVGAIAPSSRHLARTMVDQVDWSRARHVLEYGPGTGAFTGAILEKLQPGARFAAIELNPDFARILQRRFPGATVVNDSAANARAICDRLGFPPAPAVDAVLSGLPWAGFPEPLQDELLGAMLKVLKPGAVFVTFAYQFGTYLPAGRRFATKIRGLFTTVDRSPLVLRNLPPAYVYRCSTAG